MSLGAASKVAIQTLQQVFDLGYDRQIRELFHNQIGRVAYTVYTMHMRRDSLLKELGYTTSTTLQKNKFVITRYTLASLKPTRSTPNQPNNKIEVPLRWKCHLDESARLKWPKLESKKLEFLPEKQLHHRPQKTRIFVLAHL
jgi:hypothetical protein